MSRRALASVFCVASLTLSLALVPALADATPHTDGQALGSLTVDPTEALPGATITATYTLSNAQSCQSTFITLSGSYVDTNGDDATTDDVTMVEQGDSLTYTKTVILPADAASTEISDEPVTYSAQVGCNDSQTPASGSGDRRAAAVAVPPATATVKVLSGTAPKVTVDPDTVLVGHSFDFTITGCTGGLADLSFLDGDGNDTTVPDADITDDSATAYHGTYTVPTTAKLGDGGIVVDCTQAAETGAGVRIIDQSATTGSGSGAPIAVPVLSTPHFSG